MRQIRCIVILSAFFVSVAGAQVTVRFDNSGAEAGVTEQGTREFDFMGSTWRGGVVRTVRIPALYASGDFSYEIDTAAGSVDFAEPVDSVRFFFVHGFGFAPGAALAIDASGDTIASADSRQATQFGDPQNFVSMDTGSPFVRVTFSGGVVDSFTFTVAAAPPVTPSPISSPTALSTATFTATPPPSPTPTETFGPLPCIGDCDGDGRITVAELVRGVNIALGSFRVESCISFDDDFSGTVTVNELIAAVRAALNGCDPDL